MLQECGLELREAKGPAQGHTARSLLPELRWRQHRGSEHSTQLERNIEDSLEWETTPTLHSQNTPYILPALKILQVTR